MIVLNQGKELVRVESWDDIVGRAGFNGNLNPAEHVLSGIIGQYAFADKIRCGLSDCHTPHGHGYLVVTKSGVETNIGKDCGKNHFGVDFETMATQFDRDMRDKQARERLWCVLIARCSRFRRNRRPTNSTCMVDSLPPRQVAYISA